MSDLLRVYRVGWGHSQWARLALHALYFADTNQKPAVYGDEVSTLSKSCAGPNRNKRSTHDRGHVASLRPMWSYARPICACLLGIRNGRKMWIDDTAEGGELKGGSGKSKQRRNEPYVWEAGWNGRVIYNSCTSLLFRHVAWFTWKVRKYNMGGQKSRTCVCTCECLCIQVFTNW